MPIKRLVYSYSVPTIVITAKRSDLLYPTPLLTAGYSITGSGSPINSSKSPIRYSYSLINSVIASLRRIILSLNYSGRTG